MDPKPLPLSATDRFPCWSSSTESFREEIPAKGYCVPEAAGSQTGVLQRGLRPSLPLSVPPTHAALASHFLTDIKICSDKLSAAAEI